MSPLPLSKAMSVVLEVKLGTKTPGASLFQRKRWRENRRAVGTLGRGFRQWQGPHWQSIATPSPPEPVPCWFVAFDPAYAPTPTCWSPTPQWLRLAAHMGMALRKERMTQRGTYCWRIRVKENLVFLKVLKLFGLRTSLALLKIVFVGIPIDIYHIRF